jgi:hypothetical protein
LFDDTKVEADLCASNDKIDEYVRSKNPKKCKEKLDKSLIINIFGAWCVVRGAWCVVRGA